MKRTSILSTSHPFKPGSTSGTGFCLVLALALVAVSSVRAQFLAPTAQISGQANGSGQYNFSISLNNNPGSTSSIHTFWLSWVPGEDFLPSRPTSVQVPNGWSYSIQGGPYSYFGYTYPDGYSIEFISPTAPIAPGGSLNFGFVSPDSPTDISKTSEIWGEPILTSFIYSGTGESGFSSQFQVQVVPEPAPFALITGGLGMLFWPTRRAKRLLGVR